MKILKSLSARLSGTRLLPSQFCFRPILLQKSVEAPGDKIMQIENDYDKEV